MVNTYDQDRSLSGIACDNSRLPLLMKMLDVLEPWSQCCLDLNHASQKDELNKVQIDTILHQLSTTEAYVALIFMRRYRFEVAEGHCERSLSYARHRRSSRKRQ
jgi:hypothetical protein